MKQIKTFNLLKIFTFLLLTISYLNAEFIRDDNLEVVKDTTNNLMWQDNEEAKTVKKGWENAIDYCENLEFAGYNDWTLPNITELLSITDKTKYDPSIRSAFKNYSTDDDYWSSTHSFTFMDGLSWLVNFIDGSEDSFNKFYSYHVRCVREE